MWRGKYPDIHCDLRSIYNDECHVYTGRCKKDCWRFEHEIDAVLVDLDVIANARSAMRQQEFWMQWQRKLRIQNGKPKMYLTENKIDLFSAYKMAEYTYEVLEEFGPQAIEDIRKQKVTKAVADITFINIAVTGVIANITKVFTVCFGTYDVRWSEDALLQEAKGRTSRRNRSSSVIYPALL